MKTLQIVKRDFKGIQIGQRSDNKFLCLNNIIEAYNNSRGITEPEKRMDNYLASNKTKELISHLEKNPLNSDNLNTLNSRYLTNPVIEQKVLITKRGKNGGTYAHPLIAIDLAMWLNIEFRVWALQILEDNLIQLRNLVGDEYSQLTKALKDTKEVDFRIYQREANMINLLVFGSISKNKRNGATKEQLSSLKRLQRVDIKLIEEGKDFNNRQRILTRMNELLEL